MVFIHGGGYTYGFMESALYDGSNIVKSGHVVFLGIAYRQGTSIINYVAYLLNHTHHGSCFKTTHER